MTYKQKAVLITAAFAAILLLGRAEKAHSQSIAKPPETGALCVLAGL